MCAGRSMRLCSERLTQSSDVESIRGTAWRVFVMATRVLLMPGAHQRGLRRQRRGASAHGARARGGWAQALAAPRGRDDRPRSNFCTGGCRVMGLATRAHETMGFINGFYKTALGFTSSAPKTTSLSLALPCRPRGAGSRARSQHHGRRRASREAPEEVHAVVGGSAKAAAP